MNLFSALDDEVGLFGESLPSAKELEMKTCTGSVSIFGPKLLEMCLGPNESPVVAKKPEPRKEVRSLLYQHLSYCLSVCL